MVRQRDLIGPLRRNRMSDYPADLQSRQPLRLCDPVRSMDLERFFARGIGDDDQSLPVVKPLRHAKSPRRWFAVLLNRALKVAEGDELAADGQGDQVPLRMRLVIFKILG